MNSPRSTAAVPDGTGAPGVPAGRLFTVDVERDWGTEGTRGIDEALPWLLDLLERHAARATFFVVGDLAERVAALLPPDGPHEVASHGLTHARLPGLDRATLDAELAGSRRRLEACGYDVRGFRAPFLEEHAALLPALVEAGYAYDASLGSVWPARANREVFRAARGPRGLPRVGAASLRLGRLPANLTWLRLLHPLGRHLLGRRTHQLSCHLHEFLDGPGGWSGWSAPLRRLHARGAGAPARRLVEAALGRPGDPWITCREWLQARVDRPGVAPPSGC